MSNPKVGGTSRLLLETAAGTKCYRSLLRFSVPIMNLYPQRRTSQELSELLLFHQASQNHVSVFEVNFSTMFVILCAVHASTG